VSEEKRRKALMAALSAVKALHSRTRPTDDAEVASLLEMQRRILCDAPGHAIADAFDEWIRSGAQGFLPRVSSD